ncbi:MAG: tRNA pseudouridine(54/55) synthase Pus10 [Thermotoga sp.]|nr:MAG: tRNA pseudouridine(54/55) synthase Pus10 [Thermotoga sp.]
MEFRVLEMASRVLGEGVICDHCMGRLFARLSTELSNDVRGAALKIVLSMEGDRLRRDSEGTLLLEELSASSPHARTLLGLDRDEEGKCWVCGGLFETVEMWVERALEALSSVEFDSFLIGTRVTGLLSENEEILWAESGTRFAEPIKSELNREVGKRVEALTGKRVDHDHPDVLVLLDLGEDAVKLEIRPLFLYGRYRKLVRGIPQTRWPCKECGGEGCEECGFTGKVYPESVDELIAAPLLDAFDAEEAVFHGGGREDVDALMLGSGRPFVMEVKNAKRRSVDLSSLEERINESARGKVEVLGLKYTDSGEVERIKGVRADKVYRLSVSFDDKISEERLKSSLGLITGEIDQQTPSRVLHRRADRVRRRKVYSIEVESFNSDQAVLLVRCEGGLYVKELVSGDGGRTNPSLSKALGTGAEVVEVDVIDVKL